ncbi:Beta-1,3-N-acetylgalactosaminyltransferase 2 [Bulinus truncatus]|nr:Beta-1,3-N-acetylgalactosaminyltransferase 2 [Bulinus truncatus]
MNFVKNNFSTIFNCSILIQLISILSLYFKLNFYEKENRDLAICVLSSRNNYEFRNAIRNSWFLDIISSNSSIKNQTVIAKFVIGQSACHIHPENRINDYGCERWNISLPDSPEITAYTFKSVDLTGPGRFFQNMNVKAMHGIILKRIGVSNILLQSILEINESISIAVHVYDAATDEEIAVTHFNLNNKGLEINGYSYRPVQEILLPKGYEFIFQLKINGKSETLEKPKFLMNINCHVVESHHGLIFIKSTDQHGHILNKRNNFCYTSALSFMFSVHNIETLRNHYELISQRDEKWLQKMSFEAKQLDEEQKLYHDMIMVDIIDVYRNLPEKVLGCHQWISSNYLVKYILKTDDDCYVNIESVLMSLPYIGPGALTWWGNFRTNWAIEQHGKWSELDYGSMIYPRFACGSGNIVSHDVHSWLVQNNRRLKRFQGEDVSMGIWLSGLDVQYIQDDGWRCTLSCESGVGIVEFSYEI